MRDAVKTEVCSPLLRATEAMERRASERMDALRAQSEAQAKVLQDQVAQLTSMMAAVLGQRTGATRSPRRRGPTRPTRREDGGLGKLASRGGGGRGRGRASGARVIPSGARGPASGAAPGSAGAGAGNAGSRARASTPRRDAGRGRHAVTDSPPSSSRRPATAASKMDLSRRRGWPPSEPVSEALETRKSMGGWSITTTCTS